MRGTRVRTDERARKMEFPDAEHMAVTLRDGRVITVPAAWFPRLQRAAPEQRKRVEIGSGGRTLHWPDVDEDMETELLLSTGEIFLWPDADMRIRNPVNPLQDDSSSAALGDKR